MILFCNHNLTLNVFPKRSFIWGAALSRPWIRVEAFNRTMLRTSAESKQKRVYLTFHALFGQSAVIRKAKLILCHFIVDLPNPRHIATDHIAGNDLSFTCGFSVTFFFQCVSLPSIISINFLVVFFISIIWKKITFLFQTNACAFFYTFLKIAPANDFARATHALDKFIVISWFSNAMLLFTVVVATIYRVYCTEHCLLLCKH